jgi:hypothetical protein
MNVVKTLVAAASRKPWSEKLRDLDAEIAEVQNRRAGFVNERYSLLPGAHDGDAKAADRCAFLYDSIADADRELADLHKMRDDAAEHVRAEERGKASKSEQARLAAVEAAVKVWREKVGAIDSKVDELAFALTDYKDAAADLAGRVGNAEMNGHIAQLASQIPGLIGGRLAATGLGFKGVLPLDGDAALASRTIDTQRILELSRKG